MRAIQFVSRRKLSMNVFEQAIAKKATQRLVETLDMNSKIIVIIFTLFLLFYLFISY